MKIEVYFVVSVTLKMFLWTVSLPFEVLSSVHVRW